MADPDDKQKIIVVYDYYPNPKLIEALRAEGIKVMVNECPQLAMEVPAKPDWSTLCRVLKPKHAEVHRHASVKQLRRDQRAREKRTRKMLSGKARSRR